MRLIYTKEILSCIFVVVAKQAFFYGTNKLCTVFVVLYLILVSFILFLVTSTPVPLSSELSLCVLSTYLCLCVLYPLVLFSILLPVSSIAGSACVLCIFCPRFLFVPVSL